MSNERRRELEEQLYGMAHRLNKICEELEVSIHLNNVYFNERGRAEAELYMFDSNSNLVGRAKNMEEIIKVLEVNRNE